MNYFLFFTPIDSARRVTSIGTTFGGRVDYFLTYTKYFCDIGIGEIGANFVISTCFFKDRS